MNTEFNQSFSIGPYCRPTVIVNTCSIVIVRLFRVSPLKGVPGEK